MLKNRPQHKEVALINEQKFLAELGKLLTFMYEEDRLTAIGMYSDMFAATADEQALLLFLGSPTRQAVQVARAYNAKERKLQVHSQSKNEDGLEYDPDEVPDFVLAINKIAEGAALIAGERPIPAEEQIPEEREAPEGQFSLFEEGAEEPEPAPEQAEPHIPAEEPPAAELPMEEQAPAIAADEPAAAPEAEAVELPEEPEAEAAPAEGEAQAVEELPAVMDAPAEEEAEPAEKDAVDEFIDGFAIVEQAESAPDSAMEPVAEIPAEALVLEDVPMTPAVVETVRQPRVALLILFIILAVPITLLGVALLLIPTLLSLVPACGFIVIGVTALIAAFAGFAVLADILVMLGISILGFALGLLFLWLFIWFIGGAIVGLIKSVISLGGDWCYKEVPAV